MSEKIKRVSGKVGMVMWITTRRCNYRCHYCFDAAAAVRDPLPKLPTKTLLWRGVDNLVASVGVDEKVCISGGEPSLLPEFAGFMNYLVSRMSGSEVSVFSNFSAPVEVWQSINANDRLRINGSYHPQFAKYDSFLERVKAMSHLFCKVSLVADPERMSEVRDVYNRFVADGVKRIQLKPVVNEDNMGDVFSWYKKDDQDWLRERVSIETKKLTVDFVRDGKTEQEKITLHEARFRGLNEFRGMMCAAGSKRIVIDHDGEVYECFPHLHEGVESSTPSLGNIYKASFELHEKPIVCRYDICPALCEIAIPKYRS